MMLFRHFIYNRALSRSQWSIYVIGIVYQQKKQFDLSIKSFEKCIEIMPDYPEAHLNLGLCLLLVGDYENGWREFEWRRKLWKYETEKLKKNGLVKTLKTRLSLF